MSKQPILVSSIDHDCLRRLVDSARLDNRIASDHVAALDGELARANIVEFDAIPREVVTMDSTVWFRDLDSGEIEHYTLVLPHEADVVRDRISVLAPIGTALLGYRVGDILQWKVPSGWRRLEIVDVARARGEPNQAVLQTDADELPV